MKEQELFDIAMSKKDMIVFRNDNGIGYRKNGIPFTYGLYPGSGDLIGWSEIIITPEMVGKNIAVFTSVEAKTKNDILSDKQIKWIDNIEKAGGIAIIFAEQKDGTIKEYRTCQNLTT
ncbi:MAG TPA: VRR-NUC domain-containing protein [Desulfobacterales bacterium]|nr:VRR-NUC domain-containing protein [Desulfobacterales bacterium]